MRGGHRMTRMTRPDCAVMCNLINTHTHTHRAGMGTEVETHRRTPDGNGDGPKVSSEDGNGDGGNGNEGRVGDGEKEAKKRKKPLNSCRRQGGNGGDFGGTRKRCRKGSVGPVAANSNIVEINKEAGGGAQGTD